MSDHREWTVTTKDGDRLHTDKGGREPDVEGGALTFRGEDGELVHAYGNGWWREYHERSGR